MLYKVNRLHWSGGDRGNSLSASYTNLPLLSYF